VLKHGLDRLALELDRSGVLETALVVLTAPGARGTAVPTGTSDETVHSPVAMILVSGTAGPIATFPTRRISGVFETARSACCSHY
jgi:hypothetical protein